MVRGFIGHTDAGWWRSLSASPELSEVNFWRPGGRTFAALTPGEPFFFRLKSPVNRIGGFGLFARYAALPVWRAWEVFGPANGVRDEREFVERLERLARRPVSQTSVIGCIAIAECTFFSPDALVDVPATFNPQNLSGSVIDLEAPEGRRLWAACLDQAVSTTPATSPVAAWLEEAVNRQRYGRPQIVIPRLGQGSFRLAVLDVYGSCAVTGGALATRSGGGAHSSIRSGRHPRSAQWAVRIREAQPVRRLVREQGTDRDRRRGDHERQDDTSHQATMVRSGARNSASMSTTDHDGHGHPPCEWPCAPSSCSCSWAWWLRRPPRSDRGSRAPDARCRTRLGQAGRRRVGRAARRRCCGRDTR